METRSKKRARACTETACEDLHETASIESGDTFTSSLVARVEKRSLLSIVRSLLVKTDSLEHYRLVRFTEEFNKLVKEYNELQEEKHLLEEKMKVDMKSYAHSYSVLLKEKNALEESLTVMSNEIKERDNDICKGLMAFLVLLFSSAWYLKFGAQI